TNTVALWPGQVAAVGAYRRAMNGDLFRRMLPLMLITLAGSLAGAVLLLKTHQRTFDHLVPWLLLAGTILFSFRTAVARWVSRNRQDQDPSAGRTTWVTLLQLPLGIYLGYFGAGVGILMLPLLSLMGIEDIHAMNAVRTLMATFGNAVAVTVFVVAGAVFWPQA